MGNLFLSVIWNVDPVLLRIGSFDIRYYGLTWALAFGIGMLLFINFVKREGYPEKVFDSIFWYGALGTIIGARLGHCFFYAPMEYLTHPLEILNLRQGGLASHGAALGLLLGLWLFSRKNHMPYIWSLDRIMVAVAIGGAGIRLGNLMNSEIFGEATTLPWGFKFLRSQEWVAWYGPEKFPPDGVACHPTQIYEALCYLLLFGILLWLYYKKDMGRRRPGLMFGVGLIGIFLSRFFIEYIKNPQEEFERHMSLMMGQWLSIPFIILGIVAIIIAYRQPRWLGYTPGKGAPLQPEPVRNQKKQQSSASKRRK